MDFSSNVVTFIVFHFPDSAAHLPLSRRLPESAPCQYVSPLLSDLHAKIAAVIAAPQRHASLPDQLLMQPGIADVITVAKATAQLRAAVFCTGVVIGTLHHIHAGKAAERRF